MLILIRGLPGAGKSTLALALYSALPQPVELFEADQFMTDETGQYAFSVTRVPMAHAECQARTQHALANGSTVIVSNTFTRRWEYQWYLELAAEHNVPVQVLDVHGPWQSVHDVPDATLQRMRARWEPHTESTTLSSRA